METSIQSSEMTSFKYFIGSSALHVVLIALAIVVSILVPKPDIPAMTEITILDSGAPPVALSAAPVVRQKTEIPTAKAAPVVVAEQKAVAEAPVVDKETVVVPAKIAVAKTISPVVAKSAPAKTIPAEVEAPALETDDLDQMLHSEVAVPAARNLEEKDISEDLDKVDNEQTAKIAALKKAMDKESDGALSEQEENLKAVKADTDEQAETLAKQAAAMKAADKARIQKAVQSEQQAAANAAKEQALLAEAAAKKAATEQAAAALLAQEMALGNSLGINAPVKALGDIRQAPGNKHPAYENEDRMSGRQGEVSFLAYVGNDGKITQLKLLKSTGHRSLDAKTLSAIRTWKFYPGQEGWVEIPFKWDLKGGPQEMTATLRRSISQK
jgi:TonB family protein